MASATDGHRCSGPLTEVPLSLTADSYIILHAALMIVEYFGAAMFLTVVILACIWGPILLAVRVFER